MKLYKDTDNTLICDIHASKELMEVRLPLHTLEVWSLMKDLGQHYREFCTLCNGKVR